MLLNGSRATATGSVPRLATCLEDEHTAVEIRRELPQILVRIGTPRALEVLIGGLLQSDVTPSAARDRIAQQASRHASRSPH